MKKNILNSIRKSKVFSFFIIGMLSNVVVFAEPATQAVFNFSAKQNTKYWHSTSYRIALNSEITKKNYNSKLFENNDLGRSHPSQEGLWHVQVDADRDSGRIGVKTEGTNDFIQDNFFNFYIPDSIDLSTHHTLLSYELFGLLSEEGTTKSINGSKAFGGKILEKDQHWKKVEEYLPQTLLKNGNNELFFNRSTDSIYEYEIKNLSLKIYNESEETFIQSKINHERIFNIEKDFVSTKINLQDATDSDLSFYGISLKPEKHLENEVVIEVSGLPFKDVKPLDQDLLNVTAGDFPAYRVQAIDSLTGAVELFLAYDFRAIPEGYSSKDIRTYFFDKVNKSWKALPVARIDSEKQQIISLIPDSEEGIDYINGIIKVPEQPETTNFTPTAIKDIEFANPVAGVVSIPPPTANNNGTVNTSFPVKLPPGRSGMQPFVEVVYNSEGGNGWMGVGWDLDIPSLTLNTKWGVPIFDPELESEVYTLNGQDLVFEADGNFTASHRDLDKKRISERTFYLRKEGSYLKIIRHGNSTSNYWWEVIDKFGNKSFYGGFSGISQDHILRDNQGASGNIVHWALIRQEDQYGNYIEYNYDKQWKTLSGGISGWTFSIKN